MKKIGLIFFLFIGIQNIRAQEMLQINIESVLKLAGANDLVIQEYKAKVAIAEADFIKSKEWWLPTIYAGATSHMLNGAAMNSDGKIFTDVKRDNFWGGIGVNASWDFNKGIYGKLLAKQKIEVVKQELIADKNQKILNAISAYYDMLVAQMTSNSLEKLIIKSEDIVYQLKIQVEAGLRYKSELLLAQANHNQLKLTQLKADGIRFKNSIELTELLNLDIKTRLESSENQLLQVSFGSQMMIVNLSEESFKKNPKYLSLEAEMKLIQTHKNQITKGLLIPTLNLNVNSGMFGEFISPLYQTNQLNTSLTWKIPLGQLIYKGETKKYNAQLELQTLKIKSLRKSILTETEKINLKMDLIDNQLVYAKEALKFSAEALKQSIARQKNGTVKPFEVFQAQEIYLKSQLDYFQIIATYNKAKYERFVALGNNF